MSLGLVKEEPEESSVDFCATPANDSSLALDSLLFLTNKREEEDLADYVPLTTRDCNVDSFLTAERDLDDREEKMRGGASCVVPRASSAENHGGTDQSDAWTAESRFPRIPATLPSSSYTEEEVRALIQMGRYRLVKLNSKCRIWQYFERVFNEFGQDTTFVVCLSCRNLLRHKLTSSSAPLVAHVLHCSGHRLPCDSPESPGSRSSESVSPQLAREDLPNQQSQLLFSPQLLNADHFALRQQYLWKSQNAFLQCNSSSVPSLPSLSPFEAHDPTKNLHSNFNGFGTSLPTTTSLSPRLQLNRQDASPGIISPSLTGRRTRRSRHRDVSRHQRPPDNGDSNSGSVRGALSDNASQKSTNNASHNSLAQKAVLDAAVAFCCLDGRWFDDIDGRGMRELAQAFVNIGAQFGTLPAETLLPSASAIRSRAAEMAGLKRSHVALSLSHTIKNNGGCLAIAKVERRDGVPWSRCTLHSLSGKLRPGVVLGQWPWGGPSPLRRRISESLQLLGVLPLKDELIITMDPSLLTDQPRTRHLRLRSQSLLQTSETDNMNGTSLPEPPSVVSERQDPAMTKEVPCGVGMIEDAINRILHHPRLCTRYTRTIQANLRLLRAVEAAAPPQLVSSLRKTLRLERGSPSLSQVKFTLQWKKEIEDFLSRSPECFMRGGSVSEESSPVGFVKEKCETSVDCNLLDSAFKNKGSESTTFRGSSSLRVPQVLAAVIKKRDSNSSELLIDDGVLAQVTDYFEPFDAALSDVKNSNENGPNLGKLLPWIKTLRQYAADSMESVKDIADSGSRDKDDDGPTCEYCLRESQSGELKNRSSNGNSFAQETIASLQGDKFDADDGPRNISSSQSGCMSIHEVGHEIVTRFLIPHPAHYVATFLTPHFKSLAMLEEHERHKTLRWVKQLATEDRGIGTQFWIETSDGFSNSMKCRVIGTDDQDTQLLCTPDVDRDNKQSLNENENPITARVPVSNASIKKCSERNKHQNEGSSKNINDYSSKQEKHEHKNPTLKSLLEDDSSQLYQSKPKRPTHRVRGHPTLVSLLESSSNSTLSSGAGNSTLKRSLRDCTTFMNSLEDCDPPNKSQKTTPTPERVDVNIAAKSCSDTIAKRAIVNTAVHSRHSEELKDGDKHSGVAGECSAPKTNPGDVCGNPRSWSAKSRFTSIAHFMQSNAGDSATDDSPVDIELSRYQSLPFPPSSASSDDWWREKSSHMPTLGAVARRVLAVPVSVTTSDQCSDMSSPRGGWSGDLERCLALDSGVKAFSGPDEADVESVNNLMFLAADW